MSDFISAVVSMIVFTVIIVRMLSKVQARHDQAEKAKAARQGTPVSPPPPAEEPLREEIPAAVPPVSMYAGSLGDEVHEGDDPCHPDEEVGRHTHDRHAPTPEATEPAATAAPLWSADSLARAVVMQEILTRPRDRVRRT